MTYQTFEQLLADDGFMAWYHRNDEKQVAIWHKWIAESEQNRLLAEEAVLFLEKLNAIEKKPFQTKDIDILWSEIQVAIRRPVKKAPPKSRHPILFRSYLKVGFRNLLRNKVASFINIFGLSMGMAVTMLIALWIWDEISYNEYHENYDRIAQVLQRVTVNGKADVGSGQPVPLAAELRRSYPGDFKYVVMSSSAQLTLSSRENKFTQKGDFMEEDAPDMLTLKMLEGTRAGLKDPASILMSATAARRLFGGVDPMGQLVKVDNKFTLKVTGVYEDVPYNAEFRDMTFIVPWSFFIANWDWIKSIKDNWDGNSPSINVQLAPHADINAVDEKIKDIRTRKSPQKNFKVDLFLYPMSKWHLYSDFKDGVNTGGLITFVWLFGIIGVFVLLLACINFMNLSTARSERRAKEVGIRKVMGSVRGQLIGQFFSESILMTLLAFVLSILLLQLSLPWFNEVADKRLSAPWTHPGFWLSGLAFSLITGLIAGSYPAIYLSSFQPVKVLKGTFRVGRFAAVPRKVLVVLQFTVSVLLITGTIIVYRQIQFAKDRPVGYDRSGLISVRETTPEIYTNYNVIRSALLSSGAAAELSESQGPVTDIWAGSGGFDWKGKDPSFQAGFAVVGIRHEYGKTVGWQFTEGRDFSKAFVTDSDALVLNQAAVKYMGIKNPVGETIRWNNRNYTVIGVIKDMIMASPYEPVPQTVYSILREGGNFIDIKINPNLSTVEALKRMEVIFKKNNPAAPFEYSFVDQEYATKFGAEERIGTLALFFAILAILISCLGLYGLAAFVAEQRTKEIGIRKVLGASLFNVWHLLSRDFVVLIIISLMIATPLAWYFMHNWLQHYQYRAGMPWWIFAAAGFGALAITLLTVSYQAIKAALLNPVKSLRSE